MLIILAVLGIVSGILWYGLFYCILYSIKKEVNLSSASWKLAVLMSLIVLIYPLAMYLGLKHLYNNFLGRGHSILREIER